MLYHSIGKHCIFVAKDALILKRKEVLHCRIGVSACRKSYEKGRRQKLSRKPKARAWIFGYKNRGRI